MQPMIKIFRRQLSLKPNVIYNLKNCHTAKKTSFQNLMYKFKSFFSERCLLTGWEEIREVLWQESGWFLRAGQMQYGTPEHSVLHFPHGNCQSKRFSLWKEITTNTSNWVYTELKINIWFQRHSNNILCSSSSKRLWEN